MKDIVVDVSAELRNAKQELALAETQESELRAELLPLVQEKVAAEMDLKKLTPQKERHLSVLHGKLDEAGEIVEARRGRVHALHLLAVNADVTAARERQREFVNAAVGESQKIASLLRELAAIRLKISEIDEQEYLYVRSINGQLGLQGHDQIQERLRFNVGGIFPPNFVDPEVFEEFSARNRKNLADF
jgi:hypothetical protein